MENIFDEKYHISWMNEYVKDVPSKKRLYKFMCFFLFKRKGLTYKELYAILSNIYKKKLGKELCKDSAMLECILIYYYNNKTLPDVIKKNIKNG